MKHIETTIGRKFGRWVVVGHRIMKKPHSESIRERAYFPVQCECGTRRTVSLDCLKINHRVSCGCYKIENPVNTKHGLSRTEIHQAWRHIIRRCSNKMDMSYKNYGGRGISICEEWRNDFIAFNEWSIKNGYEKGLTIDRINNNGNYEPSNCRWVTRALNNQNRRTTILTKQRAIHIRILSKTKKIHVLSKMYGVSRGAITGILRGLNWIAE